MFRFLQLATLVLLVAAAAAVVLGTIALSPPEPLPVPERGFVLEPVTIVEPGLRRIAGRRIVVDADRIVSVEASSSISAGPERFVLPGLTDMHVHLPGTGLPGDAEYSSLLLLAHGVTTARILGGTSAAERDAIEAFAASGGAPAPRYFSCGPWLDGPDAVLPGAEVVDGPERAEAIVARLAAEGVDCLKPYDRLDAPTFAALRAAADRHGLPLVGHAPQELPFGEVPLDDAQHLRGVHPPFLESEGRAYPELMRPWTRVDDARIAEVASLSLAHGIAHTPTLVAPGATLLARDWARWRETPEMQQWAPHLRDAMWSGEVGFNPIRFMDAEQFEMVEGAVAAMQRATRGLHEAGVAIHTGTDANAPNLVPGASLHRELRLLVEAGMTPAEVLAASTHRSPTFLGVEGAGRIAPGAPADLVVYEADPTVDLAALDTIVAVARGGRLFSRDDLITRRERLRAHYDGFAFRDVGMPIVRAALPRRHRRDGAKQRVNAASAPLDPNG